jgi:hypothetical protein
MSPVPDESKERARLGRMTRVEVMRTGVLAALATAGLLGAGLFLGGAVASAEDPTPVPGQSAPQTTPVNE